MVKQVNIEPKAPIMITSCKRFSKGCCAYLREQAWKKNRRDNKQFIKQSIESYEE